jgi:hypothetical protein
MQITRLRWKSCYSLMMPIVGFITCFAPFQKLGMKASNLPATCPQCFATRGRRVALARPPSASPQAFAGRAQARRAGNLSRLQRDERSAFHESISKRGQNRCPVGGCHRTGVAPEDGTGVPLWFIVSNVEF